MSCCERWPTSRLKEHTEYCTLWFGHRLSFFSIDQLCIKWLCKDLTSCLIDWTFMVYIVCVCHDIFCGTWSLKTWQADSCNSLLVDDSDIVLIFLTLMWAQKNITSYGKYLIGICILTRHLRLQNHKTLILLLNKSCFLCARRTYINSL